MTQKFVTNLGLGILGRPDDPVLWRNILSNRKMRKKCASADRILIAAGGHGTAVDVLVEIHGDDILKKIWFNDLLVNFTNDIKDRYPAINIAKGNLLNLSITDQEGGPMKFDVILTNPPYKFEKDKNFYLKFVDLVNKHLEDDGLTAIVMPNRFVGPRSQASKKLQGWLEPIEVRPNVNKHFPGIATSIGAIVGQKKVNPSYTNVPFKFDEGDITRSMLSPAPLVDGNLQSFSIIDRICNSSFPKMTVNNKSNSANYVFIRKPWVRYSPTKPSGGPLTFATLVNSDGGQASDGDKVPFENQALAELNDWFLNRSSLGRFLTHSFADFTFTGSSLVHSGFMPIIPEGTDRTDDAIYKLFNLKKEDIEYLEFQIVKHWLPKEPKEKKAKKEKSK